MNYDLLGEVVSIVRDAIIDGLITSCDQVEFDEAMFEMPENEKEDYLQRLWDTL